MKRRGFQCNQKRHFQFGENQYPLKSTDRPRGSRGGCTLSWQIHLFFFFLFKRREIQTKTSDCIQNIREKASINDFPTPSKPTASKRRQQVQVNVTPVCRFHWQTKTAGSCQNPIGTDVCRSCPLGPFRLGHGGADAVCQLHGRRVRG